MKFVLLYIAVLGTAAAFGSGNPSPEEFPCANGVAKPEVLGKRVDELLRFLARSPAFKTEAAGLAARTLGRVVPTNPDFRESVIGPCASSDCQKAYAAALRKEVDIQLEKEVSGRSPFATSTLQTELSGQFAASGVVLLLHPKRDLAEATARRLRQLPEIPRQAVVDELEPAADELIPLLTKLSYDPVNVPDHLWSFTPQGESFDLYLMGGYYSPNTLLEVGRKMATVSEKFEKLMTIHFTFFADAAYTLAPHDSHVSLQTLHEVTDFNFRASANHLAKAFGPFDETSVRHEGLSPTYTFIREDGKKVVITLVIRDL